MQNDSFEFNVVYFSFTFAIASRYKLNNNSTKISHDYWYNHRHLQFLSHKNVDVERSIYSLMFAQFFFTCLKRILLFYNISNSNSIFFVSCLSILCAFYFNSIVLSNKSNTCIYLPQTLDIRHIEMYQQQQKFVHMWLEFFAFVFYFTSSKILNTLFMLHEIASTF